MDKLYHFRQEYGEKALRKELCEKLPLDQFGIWFDEAIAAGITEPNAMILATCGASGEPLLRTVLLKVYDERGFSFFTNYKSRKAQDLKENPRASILFPWHEIERQVRISGRVEPVSDEESDEYFHARPTASRIGAWASPQSEEIPSREYLENLEKELREQFSAESIPRPPHWGGYRLIPESYEFWQGRESRLHDRILYRKKNNEWIISRLAP